MLSEGFPAPTVAASDARGNQIRHAARFLEGPFVYTIQKLIAEPVMSEATSERSLFMLVG